MLSSLDRGERRSLAGRWGALVGAIAALAAGCVEHAEMALSVPGGGGDLAIVALVESDPASAYPVLAHSGLILVDQADGSLRARVPQGTMVRLTVFTFDSAALAARFAAGADAATLVERSEVALWSGGEVLTADGRTDWVSEAILPGEVGEVTADLVSADPVRMLVRDRVAAQLVLRIRGWDGGVDAGPDGAADAGADAALDSGADSGTDSGADSGADSGCVLLPFGTAVLLPEVSSASTEYDPSISSDGLTILFASDRPGGMGSFDIWWATRTATTVAFDTPENLAEVNSAGSEVGPDVSADGLTLYLSSDRSGGLGNMDIWLATRADTSSPFDPPVNLVDINSSDTERCPGISADDLTLYVATDRPGGVDGSRDMWSFTRPTPSDPFGNPLNLGAANSEYFECCPQPSTDGLTIYFSSERTDGMGGRDLWFSTRADELSAFAAPTNLDEINTADFDGCPGISADDLTLYLSSDRGGGLGSTDIWMATRSCE